MATIYQTVTVEKRAYYSNISKVFVNLWYRSSLVPNTLIAMGIIKVAAIKRSTAELF